MGLLAGCLLGLDLPREDKRLLTIVETDGCYADGISVVTGCWLGHRTLRLEDFGKVAATFVDTRTERAVRIAPHAGIRALAKEAAPEARSRWQAQLLGYQRMPDELLLVWRWVTLTAPSRAIVSRPGVRTTCEMCGEEIINEREIVHEDSVLCRACAGFAYYRPTSDETVRVQDERAT
jgi:formylmethanofuran dehydrogenase subunit E